MNRMFIAMFLPAVLALASCGKPPAASLGGFHSPDPAARLYAIQNAGEQQDRSSIPYLIESLDSDDPAERMWAIHALEKMTGERKGYNPHATVLNRDQSVTRWQEAYDNGELSAPRK